MTKKPVNLTHYSSEELLAAAGQFDTLYDKNIEAPSDYMERKRNRDMLKIVFCVIENELDEIKREIFMKVFFDGEKISDIAEETGLCPSTVYKHYEKALKIIQSSLKYLRLYQNACRKERMMPLESMKKGAFVALKNVSSPAIVMRLSRLMEKENVEKEKLRTSLGFEKNHFNKIFLGSVQPNAEEIVMFAGFFGVSTDYILKGDLS